MAPLNPLVALIALIALVAPAATILRLGGRLNALARRLLAVGKDVAPMVPGGLLKLNDRLVAANGLAILAASPYLLAACVGQYILGEEPVQWLGIGAVLGGFVAYPAAYARARKAAES